MGKTMELCPVIWQTEIAPGVFDLRMQAEKIAGQALPGQFVNVYLDDGGRLLPRPISICGADAGKGELRLVYRVAGGGTAALSGRRPGDEVRILGPLGNGFPQEEATGKRVILVGGGIGIPPMLELARRIGDRAALLQIVLGYADHRLFLAEELAAYGRVYVATDDGSRGTKGNVIDAIRANGLEADLIFACGPKPMLRALKDYAAGKGIPSYLSMEERMACGVGACLGCVCQSADRDSHSNVNNKRVCKDGPVFRAEEILL